MVGAQRGLLIMLAAGAMALGPSSLKVSGPEGVSPVKRDGPTANATYQVNDMEFYLSPEAVSYIRPGLNVTLNGVTNVYPGQKPVVDLTFTDSFGNALDRTGGITPGVISARFTVATWDATGYAYTNLIVSGGNPSRDTAGTWATLDVGHYTYTFSAKLPTFDTSMPATLFAGAVRNLTDSLGKNYYVNTFKDFVPATGAAATTWGATTTAACNQCHDPIAPHGGNYIEAKTCALCHNPNNFPTANADGNNYNNRAWFHQIHSENSTTIPVTYPQDIRRCVTCHDPKAPNPNTWATMPSRIACGACHNTINWVTGENHGPDSLPQADDTQCASCHAATQTAEWDGSVPGSHIVPSDSTQLKGLKVTILSATNVAPGSKPTVTFTVTQNDGLAIPPNSTGLSLSLTLNGNTKDYTQQPISQSATGAVFNASTGVATYTFTTAVPANATGTWTFSAQYRRTVTLNKAVGGTISYTEGGPNPIFNVSVDGSAVVARRVAVDLAKCNVCHYNLSNLFSHGGQRNSIQFCVQCHNPNANDGARRPTDHSADPAESIDFSRMIHRIHSGDTLTQDFTVYGFSGTSNFNEVTYPGDRRNCLACHVSDAAYNLPTAPGTLPVVTLRDYFSPRGPGTAACTGCHDDSNVAAHAYINTTTFGSSTAPPAEACGTCHSSNGDYSATKVHAR